jgi:hypothetical protein
MNEAPESFATTEGTNEPANLQGSHGSSHSRSNAEIHDRTGLYIAILALLVAGMALGFEISRAMSTSEFRRLEERNVESSIQAAVSDARASLQQQVAQTKTDADAARINARVAVDEVERMRTGLAAKGIIIPKPEH